MVTTDKIFHVTVLYLFTFVINLWHRKFVTSDVTSVLVNNQHGIMRRGQHFDKNFIYNQYGERLAILTPKMSKYVDELQS